MLDLRVYFDTLKLQNVFYYIFLLLVKTLYSPLALGIDNYLQSRKKTNDRFLNYSDKFRSKMESFIADDKSMIFTEDLKNMVHMAEVCDLDLILKMIKK